MPSVPMTTGNGWWQQYHMSPRGGAHSPRFYFLMEAMSVFIVMDHKVMFLVSQCR